MSLNRGGEGAARGKQEPLEHVLVVEKVDRKEGPRASSLSLLPFLPLPDHNTRNYFFLSSLNLCAHTKSRQVQALVNSG